MRQIAIILLNLGGDLRCKSKALPCPQVISGGLHYAVTADPLFSWGTGADIVALPQHHPFFHFRCQALKSLPFYHQASLLYCPFLLFLLADFKLHTVKVLCQSVGQMGRCFPSQTITVQRVRCWLADVSSVCDTATLTNMRSFLTGEQKKEP